MNDAVARIVEFERRVMWRKRLVSLQDSFVMAIAAGGVLAAGVALLVRLGKVNTPVWIVIAGALGASLAATLTRWFTTRASTQDVALLIDRAYGLEDRLASSHLIVARGGPPKAIEEALLQDTADRITDQHANTVVPFRLPRWYAVIVISLIGFAGALMISHPVATAEAVEERADIESAGENLEKAATEVEQLVPADTETARLAREQSELGHALRGSHANRAEALKKLSALEERVRSRRDDLAGTRADEIVSLAERRLGSVLATTSTSKRNNAAADESESVDSAGRVSGTEHGKQNQVRSSGGTNKFRAPADNPIASGTDESKARAQTDRTNHSNSTAGIRQEAAQNRLQEPVSGRSPNGDQFKGAGRDSEPRVTSSNKTVDGRTPQPDAGAENNDEKKPNESSANRNPGEQPADALNALKAMPTAAAEQAAKALPKLSEELLKEASALRANELTPADIDKLRRAAEALSGELAQIAQSKELQQALEEMARQVRPEQIEQVARELRNHENLKQELEAASRLLMENQQAKEMVAGLARQFARAREQMAQQSSTQANRQSSPGQTSARTPGDDRLPRDRASGGGRDASDGTRVAEDRRAFAGQGRESNVTGKRQQDGRGEYLYLQSKAGNGAAQVPYSSVYPQYRREAERSIQRTQVPAGLRSVVRKYFDAINPDAKR